MSTEPPDKKGRVYGGETAEERLARQRRAFMHAGLELFGTVGYRATTVRALCGEAGLTDRYFYRTFGDTEDLLLAVYSECLDDIESRVSAAIAAFEPGTDTDAAIEAALTAFFTAFEDPRVARVCWLEVLGVSPRVDTTYRKRTLRFAAIVERFGRGRADTAHMPQAELRLIAVGLVGAVIQSATQWLLSDYAASRATLVSATSRLLRAGMRAFES